MVKDPNTGKYLIFSIVSPVYQAENIVNELVSSIIKSMSSLTTSFEILLIEDGSSDQSWKTIELICQKDDRIKGIKLSRNFGQHHAITAGLDLSKGEWVIVMDCDLQDRPEEIPNLYAEALKGYDIVFARRSIRKDSLRKRLLSKMFYKLYSYMTGIKYDGTISNFGIYNRKVISAINKMREPLRAFSPMARWVGFKKSTINTVHGKRHEGTSTYNWRKLNNLALDIIISYSDKILKLVVKVGLLMSIISFVIAIINILAYFYGIIKLTGFTSLIVSIWFLSGLIILILGIIGLYLGKVFEGVKNRPLYIISKQVNI